MQAPKSKASDYADPLPSPTHKRRKTEDDIMSSLSSKKPRTRVSFSCGECHRRKQKCDRQVPCSHCLSRKVPELCKAYTPGKEQDLNARIARLERVVELALPQYWNNPSSSSYAPSSNRNGSPSNGEDDSRSLTEEQDAGGGIFQSGKWYGSSVSGSVAPASVIEQIEHVASSVLGDKEAGQSGHRIKAQSISSKSALDVDEDAEPSAAANFKTLVQDCGVSPLKISELLQELPSIQQSDLLINHYFNFINWTRYPISEQDFRTAYASICSHGGNGNTVDPSDVRFLPLLFVVLAISVRLAPENIAGDHATRRGTSLRFYWSSRRSLLIAAAIQPDSLDVVLTRLLSARFLTFDRRITECWSQLGAAVRTAQALGLHRDGAGMGMPPATVEYRRRIWSYLYHADRSYALVLGRPNSIQDAYTSTKPPSNIEGEVPNHQPIESLPLSQPTSMTFVILRHQLAEIIGKMVHHFQQVRERSQYSEVMALDDELIKFINHLPPHYALQPDTSLDKTSPFIPVHRFLLITEILFVRISLHRPYLLRRLHSDRYARSRTACFESAMKDFEVRQAFRGSVPQERRDTLSNAYREFQTAMISGIYFILEPNGSHSEAMHAILDGFVKDHEGLRDLDDTTQRELKTIEFLKSKASQSEVLAQQGKRIPKFLSRSSTSQTEQAHLLLNLQQTQASASTTNKGYPLTPSATTSPRSPPLQRPPSTSASLIHSPTMQRLVYPENSNSPTTSSSPHGDDESVAQSLLDNWCNTVTNVSVVDPLAGMAWGGAVGTEMSGWASMTYSSPDSRLQAGLDGSDYAFWEALVNQVQRNASG